MDKSFKEFLAPFKGLNLKDMMALYSLTTVETYKAGEIIVREGDQYPYALAIVKGVIRTYVIKDDGDERTVRIVAEGDFAGCAGCMLEKGPSAEFLEAVEDCRVFKLDFRKVQELSNDNIRLLRFVLNAFKDVLYEAVQRIQFFVTQTPEQRYKQILKENPKLIQRVPQKYLASFIGVTTVSLSRIRSRID